jgi:23S rRNA-/tRNA-specific pseudouridylate synthase
LRLGHIKVNDKIVSNSYKLQNSDSLIHRKHRHEPSISGSITYVGETDSILAINKPSSMPMHPCGSFRYNSLMMILNKEPLIENQPSLYLVHRLDRVTSGLVILAKSKQSANDISEEIRNKSTRKTYLARVKGKFPCNLSHLQVLNKEELWHFDTLEEGGNDDNNGNENVDIIDKDNKKRISDFDNNNNNNNKLLRKDEKGKNIFNFYLISIYFLI